MRKNLVFVAITLGVFFAASLAGASSANAQESEINMTLTVQGEQLISMQPLGSGYSMLNLFSDSAAHIISPTQAQVYAHAQVPDNDLAFVGFTAAHMGGTPIYSSVYDTAWAGYNAYAASMKNLKPGDLVAVTGYASDTLGTNEIVPWTSLVWTIQMETNGVLTYTKVSNDMTIYPNPAVRNPKVRLPYAWQNTVFSIVDKQGRLISTFMATGAETAMQTDNLPSGTYTLVAKNEEAKLHKSAKFIVMQ